MTERSAFLAAICAQPDDDTARLAFADWLDENGEGARAELIRVQIELARLSAKKRGNAKRIDKLLVRERKLILCEWAMGWYGEGYAALIRKARRRVRDNARRHTRADDSVPHHRFVRGFIEEFRMTAADWLAHADAIRAEHPVRRVTLTTFGAADHHTLATIACARAVPSLGVDGIPDPSRDREVLGFLYPNIEFTLPEPDGVAATRAILAAMDAADQDPDPFRAAREAGRRAALERNRRVLRAVLGPFAARGDDS